MFCFALLFISIEEIEQNGAVSLKIKLNSLDTGCKKIKNYEDTKIEIHLPLNVRIFALCEKSVFLKLIIVWRTTSTHHYKL